MVNNFSMTNLAAGLTNLEIITIQMEKQINRQTNNKMIKIIFLEFKINFFKQDIKILKAFTSILMNKIQIIKLIMMFKIIICKIYKFKIKIMINYQHKLSAWTYQQNLSINNQKNNWTFQLNLSINSLNNIHKMI